MADKIFRIVEDDVNDDGKQDITITQGGTPIITFYDWKSVLISWLSTTSALFVAGLGILQFW